MKHRDLVQIITHVAKVGRIDLDQVQSADDIATAKRFSSMFRASVDGLENADVLRAVKAVRAKGPRKFYKGIGLWLTAAEAR